MIISLLLKKQINKSFNKISGAYKKVSELNEELNRYNADLQSKEEQLKIILDKLPIPIYIKNPITQQHVYLNEESKKNFGDSVLILKYDFLAL